MAQASDYINNNKRVISIIFVIYLSNTSIEEDERVGILSILNEYGKDAIDSLPSLITILKSNYQEHVKVEAMNVIKNIGIYNESDEMILE